MKSIMVILCVFLSGWVFLLLNVNKNLTHHNLHAERSIKELMLEKRLAEKYLFSTPDSLFPASNKPAIFMLVNNDENLQPLIQYIKESFPHVSLYVYGNQKKITGVRDYYDKITDFPEDFNLSQNILFYLNNSLWEYIMIFETQNLWHLNADLNILRKLNEEKI